MFFVSVLFISSVYSQEKIINTGLEVLSSAESIANDAANIKAKIDGAVNTVTSSNAFKTIVDGKSLKFPYAILPDKGSSDYALIVNKVQMDPAFGMSAEIFMKIPYFGDQHLYFMADRVPLSKNGKLKGDLNLFLVQTVSVVQGAGYNLEFKGLDNKNKAYSYVTVDCKGFKEVYLNGALELSKDAVVQHEDKSKAVRLDFFINADRLENFILEFDNIPDLEFKKLPGFKCSVPTLSLDKSDVKNSNGFSIPQWYVDSLSKKKTIEGTIATDARWEGIYIPKITIEIPKKFREGSENENASVTVSSYDLIIDQYGITALTKASGPPSVFGGDLKGFKYQIDSLRLNVIASTLSKAGFYGEMTFPICKEESTVGFGLTMSSSINGDLEYYGYAKSDKKLSAKAFGVAQIELVESLLEFKHKNNQFFPSVTLDGSLMVAPKNKDDETTSGNLGVAFTGLKFNSEQPYVSIVNGGSIDLLADLNSSKLGNLPISISSPPSIILEESGQKIGINMGLSVSFQKSSGDSESSGNGISGDADFTIWTKRNAASRKWQYDRFDLNKITIEANQGAIYIKGSLSLFNSDPVYGKGYCGFLDMKVIDKIEVKGAVIFGKVYGKSVEQLRQEDAEREELMANGGDPTFESNAESDGGSNFRYWYVDAQVSFSPGIPVFSGVELNSFTGGFYFNMEMVDSVVGSEVDCETASGRSFIPLDGTLGLLAGIGIQSNGGGNAYNGEINFGIEIFRSGGLKRIATWGGVSFMTSNFSPPDMSKVTEKMEMKEAGKDKKDELSKQVPETSNESSVSAKWYVEYDFPNKTLTGDFDIYLNVFEVIKGVGPGNKAGHIAILASPQQWYVYIGKPVESDMIGLSVLDLIDIRSYLCVGSVIPGMAPMPPEISPSVNIDYNLLSVGGGLSFGTRLSVEGNPGIGLGLCNARVELKFLVLAGFDILLSKANNPVYCDNVGKRGINGWYATGQAYFYGSMGLYASWGCKLLGSGNKEIFSAYLKAYVFAQLPKPSYFIGEASFGFRVLGKGFNKSFKLELGEQCKTTTLANEVDFIDGIDPSDSTTNVEVSQKINIYFSKPIQEFEYRIQNDNSAPQTYRGYTDKNLITVKDSKGRRIGFEYEMSDDLTQVTLMPEKVYPGNEKITVEITVVTQSKSGDSWSNTERTEVKSVTFQTLPERNYIPIKDIFYSYPIPNMENFYKYETSTGFVKLSTLPRAAAHLHKDYEFSVAFYDGNDQIDISRNVEYIDTYGEKNFVFDLPTTRLEKGKKYTFKLLKSPKETFTRQTSTTTANQTVGTLDKGYKDTAIMVFDFTTSKYETFLEKMSFYKTSFSEVFNGVIAADLSVNKVKGENEIAFEDFTGLETVGYISEGIRLTDPFIHFGDISYNSSSLTEISKKLEQGNSSYSNVNLKNKNVDGKYGTSSSLISDLNDAVKNVNVSCLLNGGCSSNQKSVALIPKGDFSIPIGYYLPGESKPTHSTSLILELKNDIKLPF